MDIGIRNLLQEFFMEVQQLSKQTKMAMMSQFLGFMLDAYDMGLVLVMAPILVKIFVSPKGTSAWQYIVIVFTYSSRWQLGQSAQRYSDTLQTESAGAFCWS